jgi:hypothetical protein
VFYFPRTPCTGKKKLQTVFGPEVGNDRIGMTMHHPVIVLQ